jgi:hypothetical protein
MTLDELKKEIHLQADNYSTVIFPSRVAMAMFKIIEEQQKALDKIDEIAFQNDYPSIAEISRKILESCKAKLGEL